MTELCLTAGAVVLVVLLALWRVWHDAGGCLDCLRYDDDHPPEDSP